MELQRACRGPRLARPHHSVLIHATPERVPDGDSGCRPTEVGMAAHWSDGHCEGADEWGQLPSEPGRPPEEVGLPQAAGASWAVVEGADGVQGAVGAGGLFPALQQSVTCPGPPAPVFGQPLPLMRSPTP